jgi:hypothetical protein
MAPPNKLAAKMLASAAKLSTAHLRRWLQVQNEAHVKRGWPPIDIDEMMKNPDGVRRLFVRKLLAITPVRNPLFYPEDAARLRAAMKELSKPYAVPKLSKSRGGRPPNLERAVVVAEMRKFKEANAEADRAAVLKHARSWFRATFKRNPPRDTLLRYYGIAFD